MSRASSTVEADRADELRDVARRRAPLRSGAGPGPPAPSPMNGIGHIATHVEQAVGHLEAGHALAEHLAEAGHRRLDPPRIAAPARSAPTPRCAGRGAWTCGRWPSGRSRPPRAAPQSSVGDLRGSAAHDAGDANRRVPSASQIRQSSPVSPRPRPRTPTVRSTPSRVSMVSPERARRTLRPRPGRSAMS